MQEVAMERQKHARAVNLQRHELMQRGELVPSCLGARQFAQLGRRRQEALLRFNVRPLICDWEILPEESSVSMFCFETESSAMCIPRWSSLRVFAGYDIVRRWTWVSICHKRIYCKNCNC
jgi:hypothetical protein